MITFRLSIITVLVQPGVFYQSNFILNNAKFAVNYILLNYYNVKQIVFYQCTY